MSIKELHNQLISGKIGAVELTEYYLSKIEKYDSDINSYITVCKNEAIAQAKTAQKTLSEGDAGILCGIPLSIKDNICTKDIRTTCASKMLSDFIPPYDATAVKNLKNSSAVILGKTNMDEFAMGSDSQTSYFGGVKNPHNTDVVPGGSSGGSAASVAAGFCSASLGSDTGGSVRQPASHCGITGLKPTYGAVSRYGLIAFASSLDQIGVCAESAEDAGIILNCISGFDKMDHTSSDNLCNNCTSLIGKSIKGTKIGIAKEFYNTDKETESVINNAIDFYKNCGCEIINVSLPSLEYAVSAYYLISSAEAASNLARYDGIKYGSRTSGDSYEDLVKRTRSECFGDEVKRRIMLGNYALSSGYYDDYYLKALKIRKQIISEYNTIFSKCDVLLTPTSPTPPQRIIESNAETVKKYISDICTVTANIAGIPSISTPCGYTQTGLPIGMSLSAKVFEDAKIIALCDAFEKSFTKREAKR